METSADANDPHDLNRFLLAQAESYDRALAEVRNGKKVSHWMWYVFPQFAGLGFSAISQQYAIKSLDEARTYLDHPLLGRRLRDCCTAALHAPAGRSASQIFGSIDAMKLKSCATLFAHVLPSEPLFAAILDRYFDGEHDQSTLKLVEKSASAAPR